MTRYFIEPRTRKYVKGYGLFSFARNLSNKHGEELLVTALKTASQKVTHKPAEASGEFITNKITDEIVKTDEEIIIPQGKREEILNESRQLL